MLPVRRSLVLLAALAGVPGWLHAADDKVIEGDLKKMQGEWLATALDGGGQSAPKELIKGFRVTIKGDEMLILVKDHPDDKHAATIKLDATKTPKTIDVTPAGPEKDNTIHGIYAFENGTLKIYAPNKPGNESTRPKEFKSPTEDDASLLVLERVKEK